MKDLTLLLLLFFYTGLSKAESTPVYPITSEFEATNSEQERYNDLYNYTQILADPTGTWTYEEMLHKADQFGPNTTRSDQDLAKIYWIKLRLKSREAGERLFSAGYLYEEYARVDIYYEQHDSLIYQLSGYQRQAAEKPIRRSGSYFWINVPADSTLTVYFRVDNATWHSEHWARNPVSLYHIDPASTKRITTGYTLPDFPDQAGPLNTWEPGALITTFDRSRAPSNNWFGPSPRVVYLARYFEFFPDTACDLSFEEVRQNWDQQAYFRGHQRLEFEWSNCYWARLRVINPKPII